MQDFVSLNPQCNLSLQLLQSDWMLAGLACQLNLENLAFKTWHLLCWTWDLASCLHKTADSHLPYTRTQLPGCSCTWVGCRGFWTRRLFLYKKRFLCWWQRCETSRYLISWSCSWERSLKRCNLTAKFEAYFFLPCMGLKASSDHICVETFIWFRQRRLSDQLKTNVCVYMRVCG